MIVYEGCKNRTRLLISILCLKIGKQRYGTILTNSISYKAYKKIEKCMN